MAGWSLIGVTLFNMLGNIVIIVRESIINLKKNLIKIKRKVVEIYKKYILPRFKTTKKD